MAFLAFGQGAFRYRCSYVVTQRGLRCAGRTLPLYFFYDETAGAIYFYSYLCIRYEKTGLHNSGDSFPPGYLFRGGRLHRALLLRPLRNGEVLLRQRLSEVPKVSYVPVKERL